MNLSISTDWFLRKGNQECSKEYLFFPKANEGANTSEKRGVCVCVCVCVCIRGMGRPGRLLIKCAAVRALLSRSRVKRPPIGSESEVCAVDIARVCVCVYERERL